MPHLVVRCDKTQRTWATSLPEKGTHAYNVTWLASVIREAGWKRMCLFSDNEHALRALKLKASEEVQNVVFDLRESPTSTEHENAPSNGIAEAAVREVKRMVRAILSELETKLKIEVGVDHPILAWIARHAAFLMTRFRIGEDGKSAYERTLGRPWRRPTIVFGEQVMFKPVGSRHKRGSLDARVCMGRYVGTASRNADLLIMTSEGISRGHSLHRRPEDEKWPVEGFDVLRGLPWRMSGPQERASPNRVGMPALEGEQPAPQHRDFKARNLYVMKSDIELYGYTPQCPGCDAQLMGLPQRAHNDECRMRVQRRLQETDEGKERVKRAQERVEKDYGKRVKKRPTRAGRKTCPRRNGCCSRGSGRRTFVQTNGGRGPRRAETAEARSVQGRRGPLPGRAQHEGYRWSRCRGHWSTRARGSKWLCRTRPGPLTPTSTSRCRNVRHSNGESAASQRGSANEPDYADVRTKGAQVQPD